MFTAISHGHAAPTATPATKQHSTKDLGPVFAVITVDTPDGFKPNKCDSVMSEGFSGIPADLACQFAAMYNAEWHSIRNNTWACVALNNVTFFLRGVHPMDRPNEPTAFPHGARTGLTFDEAQELQSKANLEHLKIARIPRQWTIALRPLKIDKPAACTCHSDRIATAVTYPG